MKDKIFIYISVGFMLAIMLAAPFTYFLVSAEVIRKDDLGNVILPKEYPDEHIFAAPLNAIENGKAKLIDIYTNYIPGYSILISEMEALKINLNQPVYSMYNDIMVRQATSSISINYIEPEPTDITLAEENNIADSNNNIEPEIIEDNTKIDETAIANAPVIPKIASYSSSFLRAGAYAIDVEFEDGSKTGLITLVNTDSASRNSAKVQSQVKEINRIASSNTDVNVYVYVCSRFQDGEFFSQYVPGAQSLKPFVDEFFESLDSRIKYDKLKVDTLEESIQKLFLTDHHWNAYGMYEAYHDIISMMSADSPEIGEPRPLGEQHIINNAVYYGTNARTTNYYNYHDIFYFYDYNLPEHEIQTTQDYRGFEHNMGQYLNGNHGTSRDADHYVNFYPYASYLKYPGNNTGRRLLLLGDSYSRGISELLSSNFDEAYIFDYRRIHEIGDYNKFIEQHGITDVLFMQYSLRGVFDGQDDNTLKTIRTN